MAVSLLKHLSLGSFTCEKVKRITYEWSIHIKNANGLWSYSKLFIYHNFIYFFFLFEKDYIYRILMINK